VVVGHLVHKYDEILCFAHHGGHPASHHGPPVEEGHGGLSPKVQGLVMPNGQLTSTIKIVCIQLTAIQFHPSLVCTVPITKKNTQ